MHHVVNTVSAGPGITFKEGREEHADTSVLDTEMENNISMIKKTAKMMLTVFKTIVKH